MSSKKRIEAVYGNLSQYFDSINRIGSAFGTGLFLLMCTVVIFQVLNRWIPFDLAFVWTESLSRYLLIVITFYGMALASRDNEHVKISFLMRRPPQKIARSLAVFGYLTILLFNIVVIIGAISSYHYNNLPGSGRQFHVLPQVTPFTREWLSIIVIISFLLVTLFVLRDIKILLTDTESIEKIFGKT